MQTYTTDTLDYARLQLLQALSATVWLLQVLQADNFQTVTGSQSALSIPVLHEQKRRVTIRYATNTATIFRSRSVLRVLVSIPRLSTEDTTTVPLAYLLPNNAP